MNCHRLVGSPNFSSFRFLVDDSNLSSLADQSSSSGVNTDSLFLACEQPRIMSRFNLVTSVMTSQCLPYAFAPPSRLVLPPQ